MAGGGGAGVGEVEEEVVGGGGKEGVVGVVVVVGVVGGDVFAGEVDVGGVAAAVLTLGSGAAVGGNSGGACIDPKN